MDVDKALYEAPKGLDEEVQDVEAIEIIIEGDEIEDVIEEEEVDDTFDDNLAEELDDKYLEELASDLMEGFNTDIDSRKDWLQTYVDGLELLGLDMEDRSEPWEGACAVVHPLMSEALVKFQAETMQETFPAAGPVKTSIVGRETPECMEAAQRVQENMNYQLLEVMPEYRPEHERMLWG